MGLNKTGKRKEGSGKPARERFVDGGSRAFGQGGNRATLGPNVVRVRSLAGMVGIMPRSMPESLRTIGYND